MWGEGGGGGGGVRREEGGPELRFLTHEGGMQLPESVNVRGASMLEYSCLRKIASGSGVNLWVLAEERK